MTSLPARPDVSVVLPTYNDAAVLRCALAHLARQSLPPDAFEVVVVDDGSTDETWD
ncbi:MAG: glycosyltransferase family 2 protein, partial [bacterium]